eukprot:TRINITY_DN3746_c1_g1_i1.p1 TRINITY_DN3746_c1_g1~~TRINITY_DN3746_c1_g1_i1.p1  ORF type:complete len:476 (+),score=64.85 TRINITY_DN3746_c1_g1_i1:209-1429(+)
MPADGPEEWSEDMDPRADFDCVELPGISLKDYCHQFVGKLNRPELWPQVLILMDKLCRVADLSVHAYNAHRLVLTTFCIAMKVSSDYYGITPIVARYGGVETEDLISMEVTFLFLLDWRVHMSGRYYFHIMEQLPNIQAAVQRAAAVPGPDVELIPDQCVPTHLRLERVSAQPVLNPTQEAAGRNARKASHAQHTAGSILTPALRSTTSPSAVLSVQPYEVTPLSLLPMPEESRCQDDDTLAVDATIPAGALPPLEATAVPLATKPRRLTLAMAIESPEPDACRPLPVSPRALGRSRSNGGRFCSLKLTSPRAAAPGPNSPGVVVRPPPAACPRQPQHPRSHGARPSGGAQSAPLDCGSPPGGRDSVGAHSAPAPPGPPAHPGGSSTGKRSRIEAARGFAQECNDS